jgi:omega-6 fatty acid desaturase (delta-12 desaturase)
MATRDYTREHRGKSWWCSVSTAILLTTAITAAIALPLPWWARLPISILAGLLMCRMFVIYHDFQHGAILRRSWLARGFMDLYGMLILTAPSVWRETHNHHHKHNSMIVEDPVGSFPLMTIDDYAAATRKQRFYYCVSRHPLTILFAFFTVFFLQFTVRPMLRNPREHWDCALSFLIFIVGATVMAIGFPAALVMGFIIPYTVAAALGAYLFYVQHNFPAVDLRIPDRWEYVHAALKASSFLDTNPFMHWFTANIGYHHVHHLNARIPFYRLPEVMAAIPETQSAARTTLRPSEILRCLRLKLWDVQANQIVTFAQAAHLIKRHRQSSHPQPSPLSASDPLSVVRTAP